MQAEYPECGVEVEVGSLLTHYQSQYEVGRGDQEEGTPPQPSLRKAHNYRFSFQKCCCNSGAR